MILEGKGSDITTIMVQLELEVDQDFMEVLYIKDM
jgi:hypothetical protein